MNVKFTTITDSSLINSSIIATIHSQDTGENDKKAVTNVVNAVLDCKIIIVVNYSDIN